MYLKKVELCGFKSFADKTVLNFEQGISSIIGPNGCGKSNISDSIRWCLGETRAKSMRSTQMQDVIFGGTQTRATTGMAEVSLTFDNSQNVLPIEYNEVIVTRRLFRSGESEYYLNKAQCRLKDIRDLFLDTGIGRDGYSIIEQGKVDFLTTAKPEDRRELFEEAAGVAKYKVRREETLKRLEKIDADMARLSDALVIHKEQITQLDVAAKKAKQYKKYQEDLAKYEVADLVQQITYGIAELERIKQNLDPKIVEFETANTLLAQTDAEIQELRLTLDTKNEEHIEFNRALSEIKAEIAIADQLVQNASNREAELREEQERLKEEIEQNRAKAEHYQSQLNNMTGDDTPLKEEVSRLEAEHKNKEAAYSAVREKLSAAVEREIAQRQSLSELEARKDAILNAKATLTETKIHLDAELAALQRLITRVETEIEPSTNEIASLETELKEAQTALLGITQKQEEISQSTAESAGKLTEIENKLSALRESLASVSAKAETLEEQNQKDPLHAAVSALKVIAGIHGSLSSLITIEESKTDLIVSALGDKLNYVLCDTQAQAEEAIQFLEDNNLSKITFIVNEKLSGAAPQALSTGFGGAAELIKCLTFATEYAAAVNFICSGSIVSGNKVYSEVLVHGGGKSAADSPAATEEQIKKLKLQSEETKTQISALTAEADAINESKINVNLEKSRLSNEVIKLTAQIETKKSLIEEKQRDISKYTEEISRHKADYENKNAEVLKFADEYGAFDEQILNVDTEETGAASLIKELETELYNLRKEEEALTPAYMESRSLWENKIAELDSRQKGQEYINETLSNITAQIETATNRIAENEMKLTEFISSQETESLKIQQQIELQNKKEAEVGAFLNERQILQDNIDARQNSWHEMKVKVDALNNEVNLMQIDLKNFQFQKDNLESRLVETYGSRYETIKADYDGVEVNRDEILRIKRKMESLGAVNMAAQEEYDMLEQRYNFLLTQQEDLLKAKDDLHEVIKKINQTTVENFQKTFILVRENFKTLYRKLFGGGEADLMLTDENNLLESGIDIYAQPPGKKLQSITLCSGGEKALTAVALLFAFFMVKPSPFCILDEVDAPLDDANVGRYISMIKEFALNTQFLVVTHNKRTMEMADILYGVTMEEHGVSKIISVRMNKGLGAAADTTAG